MEIAVLGCDSQVLELAKVIKQSADHRVTMLLELGDDGDELRALFPSATIGESWESLLTGRVVDAVVVSSQPQDAVDADQRAVQLRKMVQESIPLLLVQPACEAIVGYELEMIRRDTSCVMVPYQSTWMHPAVAVLHRLASTESDELGSAEQLVVERWDNHRERQDVLKLFARDAVVIRELLGDVTAVSAMTAGDGPQAYANLGVHITGVTGLLARWSIGRAEPDAGTIWTLTGSRGKAVFQVTGSPHSYQLTINGQLHTAADWPAWQAPTAALRRLQQERGDRSIPSRWDDACRALEMAEAVQQSCRRGRTIQLYNEQHTEQDTFKGMMAAGGCAMLLWVLLLLAVAAIVEGFELPLREMPIWRLWTVLLAAPLAVFLVLQLLSFVFPAKNEQ